MIHDILLSLVHPNADILQVYGILAQENVTADFLHPSEIQLLRKIIGVMEDFRSIEGYIKSVQFPAQDVNPGLYEQSLASGLDQCLEEYRLIVVDTEKRFLQNPHCHTMSMIYVVVHPYKDLMEFLLRIIRGIQTQKIAGCAMLQYLHQFQFDCVPGHSKAIQIIQSAIQRVFFQQLSQWLIYGRLVDTHEEFFIVRQDGNLSGFDHLSKFTATTTTTTLSKDVVNFSLYELSYEHLPQFIDRTLADDVLFIGQTVIKFNGHDLDIRRDLTSDEAIMPKTKVSFWGDSEVKFFSYFGDLFSKTEKLNVARFRQIIVDMKKYVTEHLYKIAKMDSDLLHQLSLIKDFFLLGRGDLFEEFIKECHSLTGKRNLELSAKDLNRALQLAAQSVNIYDDLEQFSFGTSEEMPGDGYGRNPVSLKYRVKWPLHMIFSAGVMDRYNEIFRFLLKIKKAQHDLQAVWMAHIHEKLEISNPAVQLRNKLMFFIDNLFLYLQVDVVESRFRTLMSAIRSCEDFLVIQKEHNHFQILILSHCFLLSSGSNAHTADPNHSEKVQNNEVLVILEKIISVVSVFAEAQLYSESVLESQVPGLNSISGLNDQFESLMSQLMIRLMGLKSGPNGMAPLTQLLLRLNFSKART